MPDRRTDARSHQSFLRAQEVCRLRIEGKSFREIGSELGITHQGASLLFRKWMEQTAKATSEEAKVARDVELLRIDRLWERAFADATDLNLDPEDRARSQNVCIRLSERRARMLGLDASEKLELTGKDGGPIDMRTTFDLSGMDAATLDKELEGFFNPGYLEGAADGFKAGQEAAERKAKPRAKRAAKKAADGTPKAPRRKAPPKRRKAAEEEASVLDSAPAHLMPQPVNSAGHARTGQSLPDASVFRPGEGEARR